MRKRRFESGPVLCVGSLTIWLTFDRAHDVAAACRLAMAEVRVRLPLGALFQGVGKPGNPRVSGTRDRRFKSDHPDFVDPVMPNGQASVC